MKKSNIVKVVVITSTVSTVVVTYKTGRTRTTSLENISRSALAFITGNLNTIIEKTDDRTITTFFEDEKTVDNEIEVTKEVIIKAARNAKIDSKFYFKGERFTIDYTDFKISAGYLMFSIGYNRAFKVNLTSEGYSTLVNLRQEVIKNLYGL